VRVLFDHNVPRKLAPHLSRHQVTTARAMGWAELENGQLLRAAEDVGFEVIVTGDQNLSYQQNLDGRKLAIVVLSTNNWNVIKREPQVVSEVVDGVQQGDFKFVEF